MKSRGVTLIELVAALAIAAILCAIAAPDLRQLLERLRLDAAVNDLMGALDQARAQGVARAGRVVLAPLEPSGTDWASGWTLFVDTDGNLRPDPGEEVIARHGPLPSGIHVAVSLSSKHEPDYIAYNGNGRSCSASSALAARWGTLSLTQPGQTRRIKINMLGRARACDPAREATTCGGGADPD